MRVSSFLALLALPVVSVAAKKSPPLTFDTYLAKQSSSAPIEIDEQGYNDLTSSSRDYSVAVLLTARHAKYACQICRDFDPEWSIIGRSWQKGDRKGANRVLLTTVDFDQGRNVFLKVHTSLDVPLNLHTDKHSYNFKRLQSSSSILRPPDPTLPPPRNHLDSNSLVLRPPRASTVGSFVTCLQEITLRSSDQSITAASSPLSRSWSASSHSAPWPTPTSYQSFRTAICGLL
jgi:OST3 / OST6 family, transporter family